MALYLHCAICSRKQAEGLLSGAAWGRVELPAGADTENPGLRGSSLRACPTCIERHPDWHDRLVTSLGLAPGFGATAQHAQ